MCIMYTDKLSKMVARRVHLLPWYLLLVSGLKAILLAGSNMQKLATKSQAFLVLDMVHHKDQSWGHYCFCSKRQLINYSYKAVL